jgi:hypothetical protein
MVILFKRSKAGIMKETKKKKKKKKKLYNFARNSSFHSFLTLQYNYNIMHTFHIHISTESKIWGTKFFHIFMQVFLKQLAVKP